MRAAAKAPPRGGGRYRNNHAHVPEMVFVFFMGNNHERFRFDPNDENAGMLNMGKMAGARGASDTHCEKSGTRPAYQHFIDAVAVHVHHLVSQPAILCILPGFGDPFEQVEDKTGNGPELPHLFTGKGQYR